MDVLYAIGCVAFLGIAIAYIEWMRRLSVERFHELGEKVDEEAADGWLEMRTVLIVALDLAVTVIAASAWYDKENTHASAVAALVAFVVSLALSLPFLQARGRT